MAMTAQQQNHVARVMEAATRLIALKQEIDILRIEWDQNGFYYESGGPSAITTDVLSSVAAYAHLEGQEVSGAIQVLTDYRDWLDHTYSVVNGNLVKNDGRIVALAKLRG